MIDYIFNLFGGKKSAKNIDYILRSTRVFISAFENT